MIHTDGWDVTSGGTGEVGHCARALLALINHAVVPNRWRLALLRRMGMRLGDQAMLRSGAHLGSLDLELGDRVFINHGLFYDGSAPVTIGARAAIGPQVRLITATHDLGSSWERGGAARCAPIVIGEGAWVGAGATILPGVKVAAGCVVAAGAVLTRDTDPDGLYAGVPARRIRDLD